MQLAPSPELNTGQMKARVLYNGSQRGFWNHQDWTPSLVQVL